jgi:hypothetical protein
MRTRKGGIVGRGLVIALCFVLATQAQQAGPAGRGPISVAVKGEDGSLLSGASVFLRRTLVPGAPPRQRTEWSATASAAGVVTFDLLPNGQYTLCAQAVSGHWLNPCEWGATRPAVVLSAPQGTARTTLVLKRGAAVSIRVDDPNGLLAQNEGKTPGAHLLLGVRSDALIFHPASIVAQDSGGRNYEVTIPFDANVKLVVASSFFRLTDAAGAPFAAGGTANIPVSVPSGQPAPTLRLTVSGRR